MSKKKYYCNKIDVMLIDCCKPVMKSHMVYSAAFTVGEPEDRVHLIFYCLL